MDWDELRFVLALTRAGTLTEAAESLGVTRTTLGRRLRQTEDRLGVRLFDRTPEGFAPTPAGEDIAHVAQRMEGEVLTLEGRVLGRDAELRGPLRVSTLEFLFSGFPEVFESFLERYPHVELTVLASIEEVSLTRREADVVLRLSDDPPEHLFGRKHGRVQFGVYAARSLVERVGLDAPLGAFPWLCSDDRASAAWLQQWLAVNAPGARIVLRSGDYTVGRAALGAGIGVHFVPCFDGDADPNVVPLLVGSPDEARDLWSLTLPDLRHNTRIRAFMDHVHEAFAARRDRLDGSIARAACRNARAHPK